jgi:hypothetical protein
MNEEHIPAQHGLDNKRKSKKINLSHAPRAAKELAAQHGITDQAKISNITSRLQTAAHHGGMLSRISRYAKGGAPDQANLTATLSKTVGLPYDTAAHAAGHPKTKKTAGWVNVPAALDEGCGCDADKKVMKKIKEKYMKEYTSPWMGKNKNTKTIILNDFTELNLHEHFGKKVMVETDTGLYHGVLAPMRENCAIMEGDDAKKVFDPASVNKLIVDGQKIVISEGANKPNDTEAWSACKSQAKKKFDVYPSAYANAWASKCYKKKGGTWRKVNESVISLEEKIIHRGNKWAVTDSSGEKTLGTHETREKAVKQLQAIEASKARQMSEGATLLLREKLKSMFFGEEIVNPENEFTMTDAEIQDRDKRAEAMLANPNFKPQLKKGDTKEEAAHRIATGAVIGERGSRGREPGLFGGEDERKSKGYSRRKTRDLRRLTRGDKSEKKYEKTRKISPASKAAPKNPEETKKAKRGKRAERRTFANLKAAKDKTFGETRKIRDEKTAKESRYARKNKEKD